MTRPTLTAERLRQLLDYCPETGRFFRKVGASNHKAQPGCEAGCYTGYGYRAIAVDRRKYQAHRLAWLWMTGAWPKAQIDHVDGDGCNNSWVNLREATPAQNAQNKPVLKNNTSGYPGVSWHRKDKKWRARLKTARKTRHLGNFDTPEAAYAAYLAAKAEDHAFSPRPRVA